MVGSETLNVERASLLLAVVYAVVPTTNTELAPLNCVADPLSILSTMVPDSLIVQACE